MVLFFGLLGTLTTVRGERAAGPLGTHGVGPGPPGAPRAHGVGGALGGCRPGTPGPSPAGAQRPRVANARRTRPHSLPLLQLSSWAGLDALEASRQRWFPKSPTLNVAGTQGSGDIPCVHPGTIFCPRPGFVPLSGAPRALLRWSLPTTPCALGLNLDAARDPDEAGRRGAEREKVEKTLSPDNVGKLAVSPRGHGDIGARWASGPGDRRGPGLETIISLLSVPVFQEIIWEGHTGEVARTEKPPLWATHPHSPRAARRFPGLCFCLSPFKMEVGVCLALHPSLRPSPKRKVGIWWAWRFVAVST